MGVQSRSVARPHGCSQRQHPSAQHRPQRPVPAPALYVRSSASIPHTARNPARASPTIISASSPSPMWYRMRPSVSSVLSSGDATAVRATSATSSSAPIAFIPHRNRRDTATPDAAAAMSFHTTAMSINAHAQRHCGTLSSITSTTRKAKSSMTPTPRRSAIHATRTVEATARTPAATARSLPWQQPRQSRGIQQHRHTPSGTSNEASPEGLQHVPPMGLGCTARSGQHRPQVTVRAADLQLRGALAGNNSAAMGLRDAS
mmetsp:Transcript_7810/g.30820  ORF Transcript_7810/g.30820 Transcript_7810/m.30820 type:complete len:260 (+) Transcript_7810:1254-2033(+)